MRKIIGAMAALGLAFAATPALAQDRTIIIEEEDARPDLEIGVQAGFPTGLSAKAWMTDNTAIQGAFAWQFGADAWTATLDYLLHSGDLTDSEELVMPIYIGAGARVIQFSDDETAIGPRIPVGITAILQDAPLSVFAEIAPAFEFSDEDDTDFTADATVGARLYF